VIASQHITTPSHTTPRRHNAAAVVAAIATTPSDVAYAAG